MSDARRDSARAGREAATWFVRLSRRSVTTQQIRDFRDWRADPDNQAAYKAVEGVWEQAGQLADDRDIRRLREETARRTARRRPQRVAAWSLAAGLAVLVCVAALYPTLSPPRTTYTSGVGEQRIVRLEDGSTLRLNTDSRAVVTLRKDRRDVRLQRGQALFEVAHDPARPFVVAADGASVRALGTVFDVRLRDASDVDVVLLQGSVQVKAPTGETVVLQPDQKVAIDDRRISAPVRTDARRDTSWTERRLTFDHTPLAAAIAEVNRYSADKVVLEADSLAQAPVNGVFETGDARGFAAAAASVFDLQMTARGDEALVLRRPRTAAP
jgi:transmembrane sensor